MRRVHQLIWPKHDGTAYCHSMLLEYTIVKSGLLCTVELEYTAVEKQLKSDKRVKNS